jgi:hypothetical protein
MKEVAALCRNYRLEWQKPATAKVLGDELLLFFESQEDYVDGEVTISPRIDYTPAGKKHIELWFSSSRGEVVLQEVALQQQESDGLGTVIIWKPLETRPS